MKLYEVDRCTEKDSDALWLGKFAAVGDYETIVDEEAKIQAKDGPILAILLRNRASLEKEVFPFYQAVNKKIQITQNRGIATGQKRHYKIKEDGTVSNTDAVKGVLSSVMGYYPRYARINYCRKTAFNMDYPEDFDRCRPMIKKVNQLFSEHLPERYAKQKAIADKTSKDFLIEDTVFTTVTLNKNFRTAYHKDAGDFKPGFGCLAYMKSGKFAGGDLVFPAYRTAVKLRTGDVIFFNPHEIHGNTAIKPFSKNYSRVTAVFYYRKDMIYCGTNEDEFMRAKNQSGLGSTKVNLNPNYDGEEFEND